MFVRASSVSKGFHFITEAEAAAAAENIHMCAGKMIMKIMSAWSSNWAIDNNIVSFSMNTIVFNNGVMLQHRL